MNRNDRRCGVILVGLLCSVAAACASDSSRQQAAFEGRTPRTVVALEARGDADSLAAAAELTSKSDAQRLALFTRAATLAPDRAELAWLRLEECERIEACDPTALAATLHRLDSDNGAAWAPLLDRAIRDGDAIATGKYLSAVGSSKRFDIYWNPSIAHLSRALVNVRTTDLSTALTAIIGTEATLAIPAYQNLSKACKPPALEESDRINVCRRIAEVMRSGDTYITEMIGVAIAKRVWPEGSPEYTDAVVARRVAQYRMNTQVAIPLTSLRTAAEAQEYLSLLATHRSEQEVALAVITGAGKSADPPADWKDSEPGGS
jgi:hypothetical protein